MSSKKYLSIQAQMILCLTNFTSCAILFEIIIPYNATNLRKSEKSNEISAYELWKTDKSVPDELIRVRHRIGYRAALAGNDIKQSING